MTVQARSKLFAALIKRRYKRVGLVDEQEGEPTLIAITEDELAKELEGFANLVLKARQDIPTDASGKSTPVEPDS